MESLKNKKLKLGILAVLLFILSLCQADIYQTRSGYSNQLIEGEVLQNVQKLSRVSKPGIEAMLFLAGLQEFKEWMNYPFTIYRITYQTQFKGKEITASGLVCVPEGVEGPVPIISAQHGTIFSDKEAPSAFNFPNQLSTYSLLSSVGYITFIPDYIGYGESSEILHPYYNYDYSTSAVIDMLKAGTEMLDAYGIHYDKKLFLVGYSEGGYVTVATHQKLEQEDQLKGLGLELQASAAGAGSYNLVGVMNKVLETDTYASPSLLCFVLHSYNVIYEMGRPLLNIFQYPYSSKIPELLAGGHKKKFIDKHLVPVIDELFSPILLTNLMTKSDTQMIDVLQANSIVNWKNEAPMRLFHSPEDQTIPIQDTEIFYSRMLELGSNVEYFQVEGIHRQAVYPMMQEVLPWFESMR